MTPVRPTWTVMSLSVVVHLFRRKLEGNSPARAFSSGSQLIPLREAVHFDDHAINVEGQAVALRFGLSQGFKNFFRSFKASAVADLESKTTQLCKGFIMGLRVQFPAEQVKDEDVQRT